MARPSNLGRFGRAVLVGSAIGVGVAGCAPQAVGTRADLQQTSRAQLDYDAALASRDAVSVRQFLETYRTNRLAAALLNQMPADVLAVLPPRAVTGLSADVQRQLTRRVRGQFGLSASQTSQGDASSTGYGG